MLRGLSGYVFALLLAQCQMSAAQDLNPLRLIDGEVHLYGTSNKSDWTVEVTRMDGLLWLTESDGHFRPDSVYFVTQSGEMKSGVSPIMDRLMYRALKSAQHPEIVYTLGRAGIVEMDGADTLRWKTTGMLDLAGVRDTLTTVVSGIEGGEKGADKDAYVFTGSHRMSMREHDVTPPTAMFGALHTSEWVTITYRLVFGRE